MAKKRRRRKRRPPPDALPGPAAAAADPAPDPKPESAGGTRRAPAQPDAPPPLWGSFPLSELVIFIGLVLLVGGLIVGGSRGGAMIAVGVGLACLAGLEVSIREHFSGYRSHTFLLAGAVGIAVLAALFAVDPSGLSRGFRLGIAAAVTAAAGWWLLSVFRRRSGGALVKVR